MTSLFIEALDTWYFGNGRPFEAGEEHVAESLFPPLPRTVVGALRASILRSFDCDPNEYGRHGDNARDGAIAAAVEAMGRPSEVGPPNLMMRGPFIAKRFDTHPHLKICFPLPADVVEVPGRDTLDYLRPLEEPAASSSSLEPGLAPLWVRRSESVARPEAETGEFADGCTLRSLLLGEENVPKKILTRARDLFHIERRAGNALLPGKTTRDGYLYEIGLAAPRSGREQRANDAQGQDFTVGLACDVEGLAIDRVGDYLQLGGERRWAGVRKEDVSVEWPKPPDAGITRFKTYIATPCRLQNGWRPDWLREKNGGFAGEYPTRDGNISVKLVSVAIAGRDMVGGYNLATHTSRGLQAGVPAGSVYFFEAEEPLTPDQIDSLHLSCFGDENTREAQNDQKLGMGLSFIGSWDYV